MSDAAADALPRVAFVVQRYGPDIIGGSESLARALAERLAKEYRVSVFTSCARDYVTWRNELKAGADVVNGVAVRRFRVRHERDPYLFGRRSEVVFKHPHSLGDELAWLEAEGPTAPSLVDHLARSAGTYDYCIFFSYRYYHAYHGARATSPRAILVPTAERDEAIGLTMFQSIFRGVRALMYNSPEERTMIQAVSGNEDVPGVVVGVGSEVAANPQPGRFRQKYDVRGPFAVYIGRIDRNKGCEELFELFQAYLQDSSSELSLVLIGHTLLPVPPHPRIRYLGFLDDADKFDAMAAADVLLMPSYFESLSMVTLEAWALGRPVLVNGKCDVLKGQCIRSNAGLYYDNPSEFIETLHALEHNRWLSATLSRNGRRFFREQYDWPVIERKYLDMFARLSRESAPAPMSPLPGWFARRRPDLPAAAEVLAHLPAGPTLSGGGDEADHPAREFASLPAAAVAPRPDVARRWRDARPPSRGSRPFGHQPDARRLQRRNGRER